MTLALAGLIVGLVIGLEIAARRVRRVRSEIHVHHGVDVQETARLVRCELLKQARRNGTKRGKGYGFQ